MKITNVEAILMSFPMPEIIDLPFYGGLRKILKRDAMVVKVTCDNELVGYAPGPAHQRARKEINGMIRELILNKDPRHFRSFNLSLPLETMKTYFSVEIALMDLIGKYEGCPVSELLGGRCRSNIKLYGSAGMYMSPEGYAAEAAAIKEMGFPAYKMRPALGFDGDLKTVELMRKATGPDFGLMVDAHTWWRMGNRSFDPGLVSEIAHSMQDYDPVWLEEPLPPDDHEAYKALCDQGSVPIASGEHEQTLEGFMDLIDLRAVDYVQADVCCQCGFDVGATIFEHVQKAGLRFAFHCWGTTLEVLASAHLGVCWPEEVVEWLEYPCYSSEGRPGMYPFTLSDHLLKEPLHIRDGYLELDGSRTGLGVEVDESIFTEYPFVEGPWSFFHLEDPETTIAVTGDHSVKWVEEDSDS